MTGSLNAGLGIIALLASFRVALVGIPQVGKALLVFRLLRGFDNRKRIDLRRLDHGYRLRRHVCGSKVEVLDCTSMVVVDVDFWASKRSVEMWWPWCRGYSWKGHDTRTVRLCAGSSVVPLGSDSRATGELQRL